MRFFIYVIIVFSFIACNKDSQPIIQKGIIQLSSVSIGTNKLSFSELNVGQVVDQPIVARFNFPLELTDINTKLRITDSNTDQIPLDISFLDENKTISLKPSQSLRNNTEYTLSIEKLEAIEGQTFDGITLKFTTQTGTLFLENISINEATLDVTEIVQNVEVDFEINATFSHAIDPESVTDQTVRLLGISVPSVDIEFSNENKTLTLSAAADLKYLTKHRLIFSSEVTTEDGHEFNGFDKLFYTQLDSTSKFPEITDDELLTKVQEQTFKYFYDFGHPSSGLARERNTSSNTVTSGGSGFGLMAILVGIERGFITRQEGIDRLDKIINFLSSDADRFHGVWSHWLNGNTGEAIPFSSNDDGGDLVETSFLVQGLLTVRQYLDDTDTQESTLINTINEMWESVEWDWYVQDGSNYLTWHWSPNFGFEKNHRIRGWNESLITYVLAASSSTHGIDKAVYDEGWAASGGMQNGNEFYGIQLPLGSTRGGPLFFSHYSFLGLDPRNLVDQYANYWNQNVAHSQINRAYCIANPANYVGYGADCWGLTASDSHDGYAAHSPTNDRSVITPTAAISSMPYTPEESMDAIRHFYYLLGDKTWGEYGFYDAFSHTESWYASSYLAIDQGPIVCMIENHRSGLLWDLFMSAPEVQNGLDKLGFTY